MGITKQITTQYKALKLISSYFQRETFKINISGMAMKRNMHEVEEMRERKKQKNRESAQRARDRFKAKMRWLEDQVRHIQERHDNLVRENTYMRHMHSVQSSKLDQLIKRETEYIQAENSISNKRSHSSSDESSDNDSGCTSPKQSKFSIGFLSQSSTKTPKSEHTEPAEKPAVPTYPGLSNPTAIYGFLPHQLPKLPSFQPLLSNSTSLLSNQHQSVPALRLSPGGTMHMEHQHAYIEEEEVDVGSPVRSDSDHGIGSSEHTGSSGAGSDHASSSSDNENHS